MLEAQIRADQLAATLKSTRIAIPINIVLGLICLLVAVRSGKPALGLAWFAASCAVNAVRIAFVQTGRLGDGRAPWPVERQLRAAWILTFCSGLVWAFAAALCDGYSGPHAVFYMVIVCGITAGAVTYGAAYARVPIAFITPPLLVGAGCLFAQGDFEMICLGGAVLLFLAALIRSCLQSEGGFREASRLKNEATALAQSLQQAHALSSLAAEEMGRLAVHDALTGLFNRSGFMQEMKRRSGGDASLCLMLLDLDGFKSINDIYGHHAGDRVLAEVGRRLGETLDERFTVARLGGDEFAVLYDAPTVEETPSALARRIISAVGKPFDGFDACRVGVSIGVHLARGPDMTEMLVCADQALYAAKTGGRNRHCVFDDDLKARAVMRRDIERDLAQALETEALEVWHQPIFGRNGRTLSSFEALVRWNHPTHGWIPPADLVATAAMAGFSEPLLRFILKRTVAMGVELRSRGLGPFRVAMNVSAREMSQLAVDDLVLAELQAAGLAASLFELEITEETALDIEGVQEKLARLASAGVRIAIDDFGVGYSSLASLRHGLVDRVKIDRSFISGVGKTGDLTLVRAILNLGKSLNLEVVAEGVETAADLKVLQGVGCPFVQGYHLGRPAPAAEAIALAEKLRPKVPDSGESSVGSAA